MLGRRWKRLGLPTEFGGFHLFILPIFMIIIFQHARCSLQRVSALLTSTEYGFSLTKHRRSHDSLLFVKLRVTPSRTQNCFT